MARRKALRRKEGVGSYRIVPHIELPRLKPRPVSEVLHSRPRLTKIIPISVISRKNSTRVLWHDGSSVTE